MPRNKVETVFVECGAGSCSTLVGRAVGGVTGDVRDFRATAREKVLDRHPACSVVIDHNRVVILVERRGIGVDDWHIDVASECLPRVGACPHNDDAVNTAREERAQVVAFANGVIAGIAEEDRHSSCTESVFRSEEDGNRETSFEVRGYQTNGSRALLMQGLRKDIG
jgi:hypothetical protein